MTPRSYKGLFEEDPEYLPEADYLNPETRQESVCRLWAGFAIASLVLSFTAVSLFAPAEAPSSAAKGLVTPAEANLKEASVTPAQVDLRIAHAIGTLENRLIQLEDRSGDKPLKAVSSTYADWNSVFTDDSLPPIETTARETPTTPPQHTLDELDTAALALDIKNNPPIPAPTPAKSSEISILSRVVQTSTINNVPHHFLPLPDSTNVH